jgi:hypothetical protein
VAELSLDKTMLRDVLRKKYFCHEGDGLWYKLDADMVRLAIEELTHINIINPENVLDFTVARMPTRWRVPSLPRTFVHLLIIGSMPLHQGTLSLAFLQTMAVDQNKAPKAQHREQESFRTL